MAAINIRFPDEFKAEAQAYADRVGVSFNALVSIALREYLDLRGGVKVKPPEVVELQPDHISAFFPGKPKRPCKCGSGLEYRHCHGRR